jgi:hypothetical protein
MGPGSETSGYDIQLRNTKGEPVRKNQVLVVAVDDWTARAAKGVQVIDSGVTDDSGNVSFAALPRTDLSFESSLGSAVVRDLEPASDGGTRSLVVRNGGMLLLRIQGDTTGISKVMLQGTDFQANRQSDAWVFPWVPGGTYQAWIWRDSVVAPLATLVADSAHSVDTTLQVSATTLLDDFEAVGDQNLFGLQIGGGYWFASGSDSGTTLAPISIPNLAQAREPGWSGRSMHIQFQVDSSSPSNYSKLTMDLGGGTETSIGPLRNVASLDTVVFMARGRGNIQFQLLGAPGCEWTASVVLPDAWQRIAIPGSAIQASSGNCTDWHQHVPTVAGIAFRTTADAELWLDNLEFRGVDSLVMYPELR